MTPKELADFYTTCAKIPNAQVQFHHGCDGWGTTQAGPHLLSDSNSWRIYQPPSPRLCQIDVYYNKGNGAFVALEVGSVIAGSDLVHMHTSPVLRVPS